jgi:hypothetical protein
MTAGLALPCPKCSRPLEPVSWHDASAGTCQRCDTEFEFRGFPALTARRTRIAVQSVLLAEESVCFFHAENRAEVICEDCGRLLCGVCAIDFGGRKRCPACVAAAKESDAAAVVKDRVLYDSLALTIAFVPLLIWPFTLVTAPIALGYVILGWKKPNSLVRGRGRARMVVAGIIALLQIAGWISLGIYMWLRR